MIRLLVESISMALMAGFGEAYTVYDDSVEQGLKEPCFFIQCLESTNNRYMGQRYFRTNQFCVQYFPKDRENPRRECEQTAERLYEVLECLTIYDIQTQLWGKKMRHTVEDGVLNFFVNYDLFILKEREKYLMKILEHNFLEKKGDLKDGK